MSLSMRNLDRIGKTIQVSFQTDEKGMTGRECPSCEKYFKIQFGTGLKGKDLPCHCPYCGHTGAQRQFFTPDQIEYAKSVALNRVSDALLQDLKQLEFNHPPTGDFGIGLSVKVTGQSTPLRPYSEKDLETEIICGECTLRYAIYGVFAYCPDCGAHNSRQILEKNLELVEKQLTIAGSLDGELREKLLADALCNAVSAFDAFGREVCRVSATQLPQASDAEKLSFQNLSGADKRVRELFGFNLSDGVAAGEWQHALRSFQKRHLFAHRIGVVDEAYVKATNDQSATVGRKITVRADEVKALTLILAKLGRFMSEQLANGAGSPTLRPCDTNTSVLPVEHTTPASQEPLPAFGLSLTAQQLAVLLSTRSEFGLRDDFLPVSTALTELRISEEDLELAADELEERGWVYLDPDANGPLPFHIISPTSRLFLETDRVLKGCDPAQDAKALAEEMVKTGADGVSPAEMARRLSWEPRRINPAAEYLVESGYTQGLRGGDGTYHYVDLRVTPRLKRFAGA